ncbi:NADH dehydrogenase I, K subunit [Candidatus Protochlamydia naegleriophila]|uniref:NADH-quinone oxidoreductase subunit K n=1 Tax=Candidatus Protochlamydia naegleriophila TaxID=389348 RepID=A0A0U5JEV8_9BACT|nr:NADH-quinone oxidoreductase subunit NuoK [Candidatus Protochlamydia naegleriophila]CUI17354.1 NADH dehydrogenase I, K subunit [Candidatus Protochlamydia naegleriophila]
MDILFSVFISMIMFILGIIGVLVKRNALIIFMSVELMLNAANLLFVAFAHHWGNEIGLIWVFFVLVVAAAEAAVGLAIIINMFRAKQVVDVDQYNLLRG